MKVIRKIKNTILICRQHSTIKDNTSITIGELLQRMKLPLHLNQFNHRAISIQSTDQTVFLQRTNGILRLEFSIDSVMNNIGMKPFFIDFSDEKHIQRIKMARTENVVKAFDNCSTVLDFTAGLGRDSFLLAGTNNRYLFLFEKDLTLYHLLDNAIDRLKGKASDLASRMQVFHLDVNPSEFNNMKTIISHFHSKQEGLLGIYIDSMYPKGLVGKKSAVKKDTQILRYLAEESNSTNDQSLFQTARMFQPSRIVVKRAISSRLIVEYPKPTSTIKGSTQRFDIYSF